MDKSIKESYWNARGSESSADETLQDLQDLFTTAEVNIVDMLAEFMRNTMSDKEIARAAGLIDKLVAFASNTNDGSLLEGFDFIINWPEQVEQELDWREISFFSGRDEGYDLGPGRDSDDGQPSDIQEQEDFERADEYYGA